MLRRKKGSKNKTANRKIEKKNVRNVKQCDDIFPEKNKNNEGCFYNLILLLRFFFGKLTDETTADKHDNNKPLKSGRNGLMVIESMQENVIHDTNTKKRKK